MGMSPETSLHMVQILCICIVHHPAAPFGARSSVAARSLVTEKQARATLVSIKH